MLRTAAGSHWPGPVGWFFDGKLRTGEKMVTQLADPHRCSSAQMIQGRCPRNANRPLWVFLFFVDCRLRAFQPVPEGQVLANLLREPTLRFSRDCQWEALPGAWGEQVDGVYGGVGRGGKVAGMAGTGYKKYFKQTKKTSKRRMFFLIWL